jgi:hypothetical protein
VPDHIAKEYQPCKWTLQSNEAGGPGVPKEIPLMQKSWLGIMLESESSYHDSIMPL